jgi:uncharacterized protein
MATTSGRSAPVYILFAQPDGSASSTRVDVSDRVTSLSYEDVEKGPDKLTLRVQNQNYSNFSNPIFADGTTLTFSFGYSDGTMSPQRMATITKVTGGAELTVEARGQAYLLNTVPVTRVFQQMKRSDVALQLAKENGFDSAHTFVDDTSVVISQVTMAKMTVAQLLRDMAHKEGFEFWIDFTGLHWHKRDLGQAPRRLYTYFTDPGQGDILSPPNVENDLTAKPGRVTANGVDAKTGMPFSVKADNTSDSGREGLTYEVPITAPTQQRGERRLKLASSKTMVSTAKNAADGQRRVEAAYRKVQLTAAKVTFTAIGDPLVCAKTIITLGGALGVIAGNYYISSVKSDLGADFKQTIKCRRDGLGTPYGVKSTAAVNSQTANASSGTDTTLVPWDTPDARTNQVQRVFLPKGTKPSTTQR